MNRRPGGRRAVAGCIALIVLGVALAISLSTGGGEHPPVAAPIAPAPSPTPVPTPTCSTATAAFIPTTVTIPGVNPRITVLPLARDAHGVPGTPPLTSTGKTEMAFDLGNGIHPGAAAGNALLNAHTWPDGSALGNKLLADLQKGDPIVVHGALGQICYQVTDRVEVPFDDPAKRYFATAGPPQIAIVVCSGKRLGPGEWTKRTIWYASPVV